MDALTLLKQDHKEVTQLFRKFEKLGEHALKAKRKIVDQIISALSVHAAIEEQYFYPIVRERIARSEDQVLQALEEHHVVKWILLELEKLAPDAERFSAKVTVLMEIIFQHVKEEESEIFPMVKRVFKAGELKALGDELRAAKKAAPTRPHPRSPDTPPGNIVAGTAAAVLDKGKEILQSLRAHTLPEAKSKQSQAN